RQERPDVPERLDLLLGDVRSVVYDDVEALAGERLAHASRVDGVAEHPRDARLVDDRRVGLHVHAVDARARVREVVAPRPEARPWAIARQVVAVHRAVDVWEHRADADLQELDGAIAQGLEQRVID